MNRSQWERMSQMDITRLDPAALTRVTGLFVDPALPRAERLARYLAQAHNPYCFLSGDTPVRVRFVNPDRSLSQSLLAYFSRHAST